MANQDLKQWFVLARLLTPQKLPILPKRFIVPAKQIENELDIDAIKTGDWIREQIEKNK